MPSPITFPSTTANFSLPLLFSGQAQKEFFVNQSISMLDSLMQLAVTQSRSSPPSGASEGECYRVRSPASGLWTGQDDSLAIWIGEAWHFIVPTTGMQVFDRDIGATLHFDSSWNEAVEPVAPSDGSVMDVEARQAITELIEALRMLGIFPRQS